MIRFVFGLPGTGKTTWITEKIKEDARCGRPSLLIVPEQQTVESERTMLALLPPSAQLTFEVVNFTRLANKLFRVFGGLSYHYITPGIKHLLMWQTLRDLTGSLTEYGTRAATDTALPAMMLSQVHEFKAYNVNATALAGAVDKLPRESALRAKLSDLSLVYAAYEGMVKGAFDDNADDLGKLAELLEKHRYFNGYNVYIDGFTSFTAQEYRVIRRLFAQADNVTVTLGIDSPLSSAMALSGIKETAKRLMTDAGEKYEAVILDTFHRFASEELCRIGRSLWNFETTAASLPEMDEKEPRSVSVLRCATPYAEAEAAANTVLSLLQSGYRRREIAVIARNADSYRGIIDSAFEKAEIPFFFSEKTDLPTKPLVSMLLSALNIKSRNWRMNDVMAYVKSGIPDIAPRDADIFENYVSIWNINGSKFLEDFWTMNPEGYTATVSPRGEEMLVTANRVKAAVTEPLLALFLQLNESETVAELCEALRAFLENMNVAERMKTFAVRAMQRGDKKEAAETAATFRALLDVLAKIAAAIGDEKMSVEEFSTALRLVLNNTEIGTIPTAADEVMIGSASMLRASGIRCAILLGVCDGEFPARVSDKGFFSDNDRRTLSDLGIALSGDTKDGATDELMYCYRALTTASDKVVMLYHDTDASGKACYPSLAIRRVCELLPHVPVEEYGALDATRRMMCPELAFEALPSLPKDEVYESLVSVLSENPRYADFLERGTHSVSNETCSVSEDTARSVFGKNISLTQSRIDRYVSCQLSYYCNYVLKLMDSGKAGFNFSDSGSFIHRILEVFMKAVTDENGLRADVSFDEIRRLVIRETECYIAEINPGKKSLGKRLAHLFTRLSRLAVAIALDLYREFGDSDFVPALFEARIGKDGIEAPTIELADGSTVNICGVVDRIDVFRRDDRVYIKVVDYKTGSKQFSFEDIKKGLNTQLLLYLFAVCHSTSPLLRERLRVDADTPLLPAGALYMSTAFSAIKLEEKKAEADVLRLAGAEMKRSGILLDSDEVLDAVSRSHEKTLLAGITIKDDTKKGNALITEERLGSLEDELKETIRNIALEMKSGSAVTCDPTEKDAPCTYCKMRMICRVNAKNDTSDIG